MIAKKYPKFTASSDGLQVESKGKCDTRSQF
jgi:hypothetical protein